MKRATLSSSGNKCMRSMAYGLYHLGCTFNSLFELMFYGPVWLLLLLCAGLEWTYLWVRSESKTIILPVRVQQDENKVPVQIADWRTRISHINIPRG